MSSKGEKNSLTASEICSIIKAGGRNGLTKLSFGSLTLEFGQPVDEMVGIKENIVRQLTPDLEQQLQLPVDSGDDSHGYEDVDTDAMIDMHLAITDPVAWENKHLEGDIDAKEA